MTCRQVLIKGILLEVPFGRAAHLLFQRGYFWIRLLEEGIVVFRI